MNATINKISALIKAKRWDEVKQELHDFFNNEVPEKSESEQFVNFIDAYVTVSTEMEKMYGKQLDKALASVQALTKTEHKIDDADKMQKVQDKIKSIG